MEYVALLRGINVGGKNSELADTTAEIGVRKAALNALYKFMELGAAEEARGERLLQQLGL